MLPFLVFGILSWAQCYCHLPELFETHWNVFCGSDFQQAISHFSALNWVQQFCVWCPEVLNVITFQWGNLALRAELLISLCSGTSFTLCVFVWFYAGGKPDGFGRGNCCSGRDVGTEGRRHRAGGGDNHWVSERRRERVSQGPPLPSVKHFVSAQTHWAGDL